MDHGIPALVIGAIMLLGASFLARGSIVSYDRLGQRVKEVQARTMEQAQTRLVIQRAVLDGNRDTLTVELRNDGQTSLGDWASADVMVSYTSAAGARIDRWFPYASGVPAANEWGLTSIAPDAYEPGILNPGETATLRVELSPDAKAATTHLIVVSTDSGVTMSSPFSK